MLYSNRERCICPTPHVVICPNFGCLHLSDYAFHHVGICPTTFSLCWHLSDYFFIMLALSDYFFIMLAFVRLFSSMFYVFNCTN